MFKIFGFILLSVTLFGGFVLSDGKLKLLWHPYEMLMLFGPALSCFLIANPWSVVKDTVSQIKDIFKNTYTLKFYQHSLLLMFELTRLYKDKGNVELENHIDSPEKSSIFQKYPDILKHKTSVSFITENLRLVTNGKFIPHDVDAYIDAEIEAYMMEASLPSRALDQLADALPSLGIVCAVLGIIVTMQHISGTASELGQHISSALFGTFGGVFSAYAIIAPISKSMQNNTEKQRHYFEVLKSNIVSIVHGYSPHVAVEIARKNIPPALRISETEINKALRGEA